MCKYVTFVELCEHPYITEKNVVANDTLSTETASSEELPIRLQVRIVLRRKPQPNSLTACHIRHRLEGHDISSLRQLQ